MMHTERINGNPVFPDTFVTFVSFKVNCRQAREGPLGDKVNRRQAREGPLEEKVPWGMW